MDCTIFMISEARIWTVQIRDGWSWDTDELCSIWSSAECIAVCKGPPRYASLVPNHRSDKICIIELAVPWERHHFHREIHMPWLHTRKHSHCSSSVVYQTLSRSFCPSPPRPTNGPTPQTDGSTFLSVAPSPNQQTDTSDRRIDVFVRRPLAQPTDRHLRPTDRRFCPSPPRPTNRPTHQTDRSTFLSVAPSSQPTNRRHEPTDRRCSRIRSPQIMHAFFVRRPNQRTDSQSTDRRIDLVAFLTYIDEW